MPEFRLKEDHLADELFNRIKTAPDAKKPGGKGLGLLGWLGITLGAFVVGILLMMYLVSGGYVDIQRFGQEEPQQVAEALPSGSPVAVDPSPTPTATTDTATTEERVAEAVAAPIEQRLAGVETRLNELDLRAQAARGNAARAEGLLVAFATRRALERGAELGYLRDQLRLRFEDAQPNAVDAVFAAADDPVTLDDLTRRLDALAPRLGDTSASTTGWQRFRNELSSMFTIRRAETASPKPSRRIERAQQFLQVGRIEPAIAEVSNLPNAEAAASWLADARRFLAAQRALERLELAAILEPRALGDSSGTRLDRPSPARETED